MVGVGNALVNQESLSWSQHEGVIAHGDFPRTGQALQPVNVRVAVGPIDILLVPIVADTINVKR